MTITEQKRGGFSVHFIGDGGRRVCKRLDGCTTLAEAQELCRLGKIEQIELASRAGVLRHAAIALALDGQELKVEDAIQRFLDWKRPKIANSTIKRIEIILASLGRSLGKRMLSTIIAKDIDDYLHGELCLAPGRYKRGHIKVGTLELHHRWIRSFLKWANMHYFIGADVRNVRLRINAMAHEQKESQPPLPFTFDEMQRMLKTKRCHYGSFWRPAIILGWKLGLRISDAVHLDWASTRDGVVWTKKTGKRVVFPIDDELKAEFSRLHSTDPRWVFPTERAVFCDNELRLHRDFGCIQKSAKISPLRTWRAFRYGLAQHMEKLYGVEAAQQLLGHRRKETTQIYLRPPDTRPDLQLVELKALRSINSPV